MSEEKSSKKLAAVLVRGLVEVKHEVKDTLRMEKIAIIKRLMQVGNS